ncbi:MAG: hypothetical protein WAW15_01365 [Minisyncoccales bacterium]
MTIEELFQKANKDRIELKGHKEKLKAVLLKNEYFDVEKEYWDWKLAFSSLSFSALLIIFSFSIVSNGNTNQTTSESRDFYKTIQNSPNVSGMGEETFNGEKTNVLQMVDGGTMTKMYFNSRNVLVHSEVYNK